MEQFLRYLFEITLLRYPVHTRCMYLWRSIGGYLRTLYTQKQHPRGVLRVSCSPACLKWFKYYPWRCAIFVKQRKLLYQKCTPPQVISCQNCQNSEEQLFRIKSKGCFCVQNFDHKSRGMKCCFMWWCAEVNRNKMSTIQSMITIKTICDKSLFIV